MTKEEKQLLLTDLSARLPYHVKVEITVLETNKVIIEEFDYMWLGILYSDSPHHIIKPYLRPISSMTEEEIKELSGIDMKRLIFSSRHLTWHLDGEIIDYLNKKMFDYRGLIEKGLALEAPEGMYN